MKQSRWLLPAILLTILLIVGFQTFWLVKSFQSEKKLLQVESTILLRETFYDTWRGRADGPPKWVSNGPFPDGPRTSKPAPHDAEEDSLHHRWKHHRHLEPYTLGRLQPDSLGPVYQERLAKVHPKFRSQLLILNEGDTLPQSFGIMRTLPLPWNWEKQQTLAADITGFGAELTQRLVPHVLISLLLVLSTVGTMLLLYRTVRRGHNMAQQQRQFISDVTHELKTPVATVQVALEALKNFSALDDRTKTQEYLKISILELNRLNRMADRILQVSQLESGVAQLRTEPCQLDQLAQQCVNSMLPFAEQRKSKLLLSIEPGSYAFTGDPVLLTNAFVNLIDNALKYSPDSTTVEVLVRHDSNHLLLTVADSGPGIASEHKEKIFHKFYRIREGDQHNVRGYGLGLSYVREVTHLHHGTIRLDSSPGQGSRFTISLPKSKNDTKH
jgi:signal transduction histidine kinase